jgi:hypothetical protein
MFVPFHELPAEWAQQGQQPSLGSQGSPNATIVLPRPQLPFFNHPPTQPATTPQHLLPALQKQVHPRLPPTAVKIFCLITAAEPHLREVGPRVQS